MPWGTPLQTALSVATDAAKAAAAWIGNQLSDALSPRSVPLPPSPDSAFRTANSTPAVASPHQQAYSAVNQQFGQTQAGAVCVDCPKPDASVATNTQHTPGTKLAPKEFVAVYGPAARASERVSGVPALVTLAQAAIESNWGESAPNYNFFGIKASASDPPEARQLLRTKEVLSSPNVKFPEVISVTARADGKFDYVVKDWFRTFPDAQSAFDGHGQFLRNNKRYERAFTRTNDPYAFAAEVAAAEYATDPNYDELLPNVMRTIVRAGGP
jgi:flagellum-specific peptidoglycan hydrolase FlgJ